MKITLSILNFIMIIIFSTEMLNLYIVESVPIIRSEVNREFIVWVGFIFSWLNISYLFKNKSK